MSYKYELRIFCENVRYLRRIHGLSLAEMSQMLEIDMAQMQSLEDGIVPKDMEITVLFSIEKAFQLPASCLLEPFFNAKTG